MVSCDSKLVVGYTFTYDEMQEIFDIYKIDNNNIRDSYDEFFNIVDEEFPHLYFGHIAPDFYGNHQTWIGYVSFNPPDNIVLDKNILSNMTNEINSSEYRTFFNKIEQAIPEPKIYALCHF